MITFLEDRHLYINDRQEHYTSVTTLLKQLEPKKDWDKIKKNYAKKNKLTVEEVTAMWDKKRDDACAKGTAYHKFKELELVQNFTQDNLVVYPSYCIGGEKKSLEIQKIKDGIYPELIIWLDSIRVAGQADLIVVRDGYIHIKDHKGLELNTDIPTISGFKKIKDINVGDIIFDGYGNPTEVEHVSQVHHNPCYKIIFDTNDTIICDHEHKWVTSERVGKGLYEDKEYTTDEVFENFSKEKMRIRCTTINTKEKELPIDPYVLGVWLGDGSKATGTVTNMNDCLWNEIESRGYKLGGDISGGGCGKAQLRTVLSIRKELNKLNLLGNKHIPDIYLRSSFNQRLDLLRGFMDTDGYYNKIRDLCVMTTTQEWQRDYICQIVSSLGLKPTSMKATTSGFGKTNIPCFLISFRSSHFSPFLCKEKNYMLLKHKKSERAKFRYIKSINKVDTVPTKCLSVKSSTHCYLATKNYIKTHNTNRKIEREGFKNWEGKQEMLLAPVSHLPCCNYSIYTLQLSMYMYMLLRHNPHLKAGTLELLHIPFEENPENPNEEIAGTPIPIKVPYRKTEVQNIITWLKMKK